MTKHTSPLDWQVPAWHDDFGDPRIEFEALRSLAIAVCNANAGVKTELETPEPGMMELTVELPSSVILEIHSVVAIGQKEKRRFAVFVSPETNDEAEYYFDSEKDAVEFIAVRSAS